ncbi:hypothetical protein [Kordiimonas gwangyangensis]|uniref:hypothetical protein n=1 Tax=Kordiimonas gwangyangensis TaxID=288022 RepID=UPI00035CD97B|nr:hypothetical protein [Kordiimonas gwangyangensis]
MQSIKNLLSTETFERAKDNKPLMIALKSLQFLFMGAVVYYLVSKLTVVGWREVWDALPTTPWFYIIFIVMFFAFPIAELMVYRLMWNVDFKGQFGVFVRKRVYNYAVLSYSGEAYMAFWARRRLDIRDRVIFSTIKDSNILSGLASNSFTVVMLAIFFMTGQLSVITDADPDYKSYLILAVMVGVILVPVVLRFRKHIISLKPEVAKKVFAIHFARMILLLLLQTLQWSVVLPEVPFNMWFLFLTAQLVLTRVPFLPNTDLLVAGLGLTLMGYVDAPQATLASMFLAAGALSQAMNLAAFLATSVRLYAPVGRGHKYPQQDEDENTGDLAMDEEPVPAKSS